MLRLILGAALSLLPVVAQAHAGAHVGGGFAHGFVHPFSGLDHLLVMVAVGVLAAQKGGRALWLVPGAFLAMMIAGGAAGMARIEMPFVEAGIGLSVVALGLLVACAVSLPTAAAMTIVGLFALFHGFAHGVEMPAEASGLSYGSGFVAATALLHAAGLGVGIALGAMGGHLRRVAQFAGGAMSLAGLAILGGAI